MRYTYNADQDVLHLLGSMKALARVVGAIKVTLFELRHQCASNAVAIFSC